MFEQYGRLRFFENKTQTIKMSKELTISQALKEKKKIIAKLSIAKSRAMQSNRATTDSPADYNVPEQMESVLQLQTDLINLKVRIQTANLPILEKIYRLSELKDYAKLLQQIPTGKGRDRVGYGANAEVVEFTCQVGRLELDKKKEETEAKIEALQEELDQFNHTTKI